MAQSKFEQEMYDEAYKVASYLKQTGQDSVFLRLVKEKGSRFFLNATALSLTLAGMSMKLALRLTTLVLRYGLRVVTAILDILDGKAKGIKVTIETNK
ncbi:hypothetical protein G8B22_10015 [Ligilactobacillus agilis]|uniref:hypothetical protein n=1 Tax=Ligilactobacillus agilis TaxID=1601 RepID=UPI00067EBF86|nr:hypothetical protein [Ligilactobacillus agilis]UNL43451.1 hypothetical protein G8B22_10015 [Ligilactobacillus agilis]UNL57596.1 hypothetical protein G8B19_01920 [Ligilactobacillus agilis]